jgi:uncharacterized membrane protein YesL
MRTHWLDDFNRWSTPVLANLLWVVLSIPVVTIPLALVGLLAVMFRWMDERDTALFTVFFGTIRRNWRKSYLVALLDILLGSLVYFNLLVFQVMDMNNVLAFLSRSVTFYFAILLIIYNVYVWTLLAVWDKPLKHILKFSLQLLFTQPLWSILIAVAVITPPIVSTIMPTAVWVTLTGAVSAYIACRGTWFIVTKYISPQEFAWIPLE